MTAGMTDVIIIVMAEVLCIVAIATKEVNQSPAGELVFRDGITSVYLSSGTFLKNLVGRKDIDIGDALQRLDKVTADEGRMATAEALNTLHGVGDKVSGVGRKVYGVQSILKAFEDRMRGVEDRVMGVEVTLQGVDVRVKDIRNKVINGMDTIFWPFASLSTFIYCSENQDDRTQPTFLR